MCRWQPSHRPSCGGGLILTPGRGAPWRSSSALMLPTLKTFAFSNRYCVIVCSYMVDHSGVEYSCSPLLLVGRTLQAMFGAVGRARPLCVFPSASPRDLFG